MDSLSVPPMSEEPPEPESLREALRLNDAHIAGLTRLDQQLVYVPLTTLAGAIAVSITKPSALAFAAPSLMPVGLLVGLVVSLGLLRNHRRHLDLFDYKQTLLRELRLPIEPRRDRLIYGRLVYFGLFVIGLSVGGIALIVLLWTAQE
jgi:hypothetical protein